MAPDLRVQTATMASIQSTLNRAANMLEPLQRSLNHQDTGVVGAGPLAEKLQDAQGNLAGGIGIGGQALAAMAEDAATADTSYGSTDGRLAGVLPRGAR